MNSPADDAGSSRGPKSKQQFQRKVIATARKLRSPFTDEQFATLYKNFFHHDIPFASFKYKSLKGMLNSIRLLRKEADGIYTFIGRDVNVIDEMALKRMQEEITAAAIGLRAPFNIKSLKYAYMRKNNGRHITFAKFGYCDMKAVLLDNPALELVDENLFRVKGVTTSPSPPSSDPDGLKKLQQKISAVVSRFQLPFSSTDVGNIYKNRCKEPCVPFKQFGYKSLTSFLQAHPDLEEVPGERDAQGTRFRFIEENALTNLKTLQEKISTIAMDLEAPFTPCIMSDNYIKTYKEPVVPFTQFGYGKLTLFLKEHPDLEEVHGDPRGVCFRLKNSEEERDTQEVTIVDEAAEGSHLTTILQTARALPQPFPLAAIVYSLRSLGLLVTNLSSILRNQPSVYAFLYADKEWFFMREGSLGQSGRLMERKETMGAGAPRAAQKRKSDEGAVGNTATREKDVLPSKRIKEEVTDKNCMEKMTNETSEYANSCEGREGAVPDGTVDAGGVSVDSLNFSATNAVKVEDVDTNEKNTACIKKDVVGTGGDALGSESAESSGTIDSGIASLEMEVKKVVVKEEIINIIKEEIMETEESGRGTDELSASVDSGNASIEVDEKKEANVVGLKETENLTENQQEIVTRPLETERNGRESGSSDGTVDSGDDSMEVEVKKEAKKISDGRLEMVETGGNDHEQGVYDDVVTPETAHMQLNLENGVLKANFIKVIKEEIVEPEEKGLERDESNGAVDCNNVILEMEVARAVEEVDTRVEPTGSRKDPHQPIHETGGTDPLPLLPLPPPPQPPILFTPPSSSTSSPLGSLPMDTLPPQLPSSLAPPPQQPTLLHPRPISKSALLGNLITQMLEFAESRGQNTDELGSKLLQMINENIK